jgi:Nif-specific regulatory protein
MEESAEIEGEVVGETERCDTPQGPQHPLSRPPLERQVGELLALYEIGQALGSVSDLDHLLQLAIERVLTLLDVDAASVILLDEERHELYFKVADDSRVGRECSLREVRFPADRGIAGAVLREGVSVVVPDVDQDPRHYRGVDLQTGTKTQSLICVPLRTKERIIGVLEAINQRQASFIAEDVRLLEAFANQLALALDNAHLIQELQAARERLSEENRYLREAVKHTVQFSTLIGESPKMQEVYRLVECVLHTTATVLITGESGTGKDLVARILHYQGPRREGPFIAVNCAAIPEALLEAELFGYEKGAFTGATQRKPGRFELASGGTFFLNEIAEMSPLLQAKLLHVLQEQRFERVGGTATIATDARIIAATNQDLDRLIREGRFRPDLFYRLNVYHIPMPALREHAEDIIPLALHCLRQSSHELRKEKGLPEVIGLSSEARELLVRYAWPGNVRELENVIERAVILCQGSVVTPQELPLVLRERSRAAVWRGEATHLPAGGISVDALLKQLIQQGLHQAHGNKSRAAKLLGLSRTRLRTRLKQYGLEAE